jgi:hypothetical protein
VGSSQSPLLADDLSIGYVVGSLVASQSAVAGLSCGVLEDDHLVLLAHLGESSGVSLHILELVLVLAGSLVDVLVAGDVLQAHGVILTLVHEQVASIGGRVLLGLHHLGLLVYNLQVLLLRSSWHRPRDEVNGPACLVQIGSSTETALG